MYWSHVWRKVIPCIVRNAQWWAANHSPEKAVEWQVAIFARINSLDVMPESNPVAFENSDFPYELREARFGLGPRPGYRILFTIVDDTVNVLTVTRVNLTLPSPRSTTEPS